MITYTETTTINKQEAVNMQMEIDNNLVCIEQVLDKLKYLNGLTEDLVSKGYIVEIENRCNSIRQITDKLWKK